MDQFTVDSFLQTCMFKVAMLHDVSLKSFERKIALAKYVVDALCDAEQDRPVSLS